MPLNYSAAHSSRITKARTRNPLLRRSASSPFAGLPRSKPLQRSKSKPEVIDDEDDFFGDRLDDAGPVVSLATDVSVYDVTHAMQYMHTHMFDELPDRGGMNSTRIAEVLNFRKSLPPIVTIAHIHAMIGSPTAVEKEIAELTRAGVIRKLVVPGRGSGGASIGEGLVLVEHWERMVAEASHLAEDLKRKFAGILRKNPTALVLHRAMLDPTEGTTLMRAGFLTTSSQLGAFQNSSGSSDPAAMGTLTSISSISRAASGSLAAVGGEGAFHDAGGGGGILGRGDLDSEDQSIWDYQSLLKKGGDFCISVPSTGPYLQLLVRARAHLMTLLGKSKYREAPLYLLRERWDGGIAHDDAAAKSKKARGEFVGILPSKTRKWKQFYGLAFDWVLGECLGAGLIEVFETGSVGRGVRAVT